jgi:hypothetical protein
VRKVTYQTIGHELTHLIQGLAHGDPELPQLLAVRKISWRVAA